MLKRYGPYIIPLLVALLHLPFMQADPDGLLAWHSRGAWTDEGLYTAQARNLVHSGYLGADTMDGFAKTPLFTLYILPFLALLGTHLWVARLAVLLFSLATTYQFIKQSFKGVTYYWAWGIIALQYLVFTYSHFAMAEMMGASCIVWSALWYSRYTATQRYKYVVYAALFAVLAFGCKTSYLFAIGILLVCLAILTLTAAISKNRYIAQKHLKAVLVAMGVYSGAFIAMYILFYLPNKATYAKIIAQDVAAKFSGDTATLHQNITINALQIANENTLLIGVAAAFLLLLLPVFIKLKHKKAAPGNALLQFCSVWLLLEIPKLGIAYLPSRYLVSAYLCIAIIIAVSCQYLYTQHYKKIAWAAAAIIILLNCSYWVESYTRRSFQVQTVNTYLAQTADSKRTMLGTWAPTACWESQNVTLPVWEGYFNDWGFMEKYQPQAIITEVDERDAGYIFSKRGVNLKQQSDSVRIFTIAEWQVAVHWIRY